MNIKIFGLDKLTAKLRRLSAPELTREMEKTTRKAVNYVHGKVPPYPPKPVGSTYERRGAAGLGGSINTKVKKMGSNVIGTIGSPTPYAPWVISEEPGGGAGPQAWMHKGRWWTLQGVVKKAQDAVNRIFENMVKRLTR